MSICPTLAVRLGRVIDTDPHTNRTIASRQFVDFISNRTCGSCSWPYGELRGGTNAILIGNKYLALFHSRGRVKGSFRYTYFMGAYTFSPHPPFTLLQISRYPIVHHKLYEGPTFSTWRRKAPNNYIVFPMNIYEDNDSLMVSIGTQDRRGWLCRLNYTAILLNMEDLLVPRVCYTGEISSNCDPAELDQEAYTHKRKKVKSKIYVG
jgi:hypothetical protein